jgi:hypothetical protein
MSCVCILSNGSYLCALRWWVSLWFPCVYMMRDNQVYADATTQKTQHMKFIDQDGACNVPIFIAWMSCIYELSCLTVSLSTILAMILCTVFFLGWNFGHLTTTTKNEQNLLPKIFSKSNRLREKNLKLPDLDNRFQLVAKI